MSKFIGKPDEIGIRNRKVNEASWWIIWIGAMLTSIGLLGINRSQDFRSMDSIRRAAEKEAQSN